ncbi:Polyadenylate-binding protein [Umbelopsis nana]
MQEAINEAPIAAGRPFRSSSTSSETKASKLYVGELDSAVNESDLFAVFSELGKVSSLRISRDAITGISLGYGFIEYDPSQSVRLVEQIKINGKQARVMWQQRREKQPEQSDYVIYLKNLDKATSEKALLDTFSAFGSIVSCTLLPDTESSLEASISFDTIDAANKAVQNVNSSLWNERRITASHEPFEPNNTEESGTQPSRTNGLHVKSPDLGAGKAHLKNLFSKFGPVPSASLNGSSYGAPKEPDFVNSVRPNGAIEVVQNTDLTEFLNDQLRALLLQEDIKERFRRRTQQKTVTVSSMTDEKCELYVRNIDASIDEHSLKAELEKVVDIDQVRIVKPRKVCKVSLIGLQ